jgi:hypothetical protein
MTKLILIIFLTIISFGKDCSVESMQSLLQIEIRDFESLIMDDKTLEDIKSSQGSEGKFYYERNTNNLKYIKLIIYGEMGKKIVYFYFDKHKNILVKSILENYNHHIYDHKSDLKVLSKITKLFPICHDATSETLFYGVENHEYKNILKLVIKLKKSYKNLLLKINSHP